MNGWVTLAGIALGALYLIYVSFNDRVDNGPQQYGPQAAPSRRYADEEDEEEEENAAPANPRLQHTNRENIENSENQPSTSRSHQGSIDHFQRGEICPICRDHLIDTNITRRYCLLKLPCDHWFHHRCALRLLDYHPACPVCRRTIDRRTLQLTPIEIP